MLYTFLRFPGHRCKVKSWIFRWERSYGTMRASNPSVAETARRQADARRGAQTGKYAHERRRRDVQREAQSSALVRARLSRETRYQRWRQHSLRPLAIYGNDSANGAWGRTLLHDIRSAEEKEEVDMLFFSSRSKETTPAERQRPKGLRARGRERERRSDRSVLLFRTGHVRTCFAMWKIVRNNVDGARKTETIFTLFPRRPRFYIRSVTFNVEMPTVATNQAVAELWRRMYDGGDLSTRGKKHTLRFFEKTDRACDYRRDENGFLTAEIVSDSRSLMKRS